jgi:two-component system CheB/CheR fusion protein
MSSKPAKGKGDGRDDGAENGDDLENGNGGGNGNKGKKHQEAPASPSFEALLQYLKRTRGFDFANYKRAGLARRFEKRMQTVGMPDGDFAAYQDYLEVHPEEFAHLFNTILINVTGFFRDPTAWDYLAAVVVPEIVSKKRDGDPIRVWSAACASGEEAYSLAILFAEAMGTEAFCERVKIYATDVDEDALNTARQASYGPREIAGVSPPLLKKYFEPSNGRFVFHKDMRRCVIFGRHDLFEDAPISRVDMLACRNALMYFNAEAQGRILTRPTSP